MIKVCPFSGDVAGVINFSHLRLLLQNHSAHFKRYWLKEIHVFKRIDMHTLLKGEILLN